MADREYDRNRYRRMYDDQGRYGSGREYRSGRDVDTEYSRDRSERWTAGRENYGREGGYGRESGSGRESGYSGMSGRGSRSGYEGSYTREGRVGGEPYRTSYNTSGLTGGREDYGRESGRSSGRDYGRESGRDYSRDFSGNYGRDYDRNYSTEFERGYGRDTGYGQSGSGQNYSQNYGQNYGRESERGTRSFGETDDYNYGYGGEGYAPTSYGYGRGFSGSPQGGRANRDEQTGQGYNYGQGYGSRSERNFDRYSGGEYNPDERGFFSRAADEVKSWFGDEEAERRRQMDERYSGSETSGYGGYSSYGMFTGRGPKNYRRSDERIMEDVNERLMQHPDIDASDIDVSVSDGVVTLSGTVDRRRSKHLAEDVAESVSGVKDVNNQIKVARDNMTQMSSGGWNANNTGMTNDPNIGATSATTNTGNTANTSGTSGTTSGASGTSSTGTSGSSTTGTRSRSTTT